MVYGTKSPDTVSRIRMTLWQHGKHTHCESCDNDGWALSLYGTVGTLSSNRCSS